MLDSGCKPDRGSGRQLHVSLMLADFQYDLPEDRIAQRPVGTRDASSLMVVNRSDRSIRHAIFADLIDYLPEGALLVMNDARVVPVRLFGRRCTGGLVEVVIMEPPSPDAAAGKYWLECLVKPARRINNGDVISFGSGLEAELVRPGREGMRILKFTFERPPLVELEERGRMPLPPYIRREPGDDEIAALDRERYQTVYARQAGAVAAPTAGLHFTPELLEKIQESSFDLAYVTLYVGYGTFAPVREEDITRHRLHAERVIVSETTAEAVNRAKAEGRPVVAIGTTTVRSLEHSGKSGRVEAFDGQTDLFIYPGFEFRIVDHLITNFHLPGSTLIMLTAALAGRDFIMDAYQAAVEQGYRFYSYGDAMLIL
jgi:S-adenosylmethionine:tRNA ribosyltransferase-isomerase